MTSTLTTDRPSARGAGAKSASTGVTSDACEWPCRSSLSILRARALMIFADVLAVMLVIVTV